MTGRYLLDSHVFLWAVFAPEKLGANARGQLERSDTAFVSTVTLWELAIKFRIGKFAHPPSDLIRELGDLGAEELPISHRHLAELPDVALPHGDPFDAMLIAQSRADGLTLVTADRTLLTSDYATLDVRS